MSDSGANDETVMANESSVHENAALDDSVADATPVKKSKSVRKSSRKTHAEKEEGALDSGKPQRSRFAKGKGKKAPVVTPEETSTSPGGDEANAEVLDEQPSPILNEEKADTSNLSLEDENSHGGSPDATTPADVHESAALDAADTVADVAPVKKSKSVRKSNRKEHAEEEGAVDGGKPPRSRFAKGTKGKKAPAVITPEETSTSPGGDEANAEVLDEQPSPILNEENAETPVINLEEENSHDGSPDATTTPEVAPKPPKQKHYKKPKRVHTNLEYPVPAPHTCEPLAYRRPISFKGYFPIPPAGIETVDPDGDDYFLESLSSYLREFAHDDKLKVRNKMIETLMECRKQYGVVMAKPAKPTKSPARQKVQAAGASLSSPEPAPTSTLQKNPRKFSQNRYAGGNRYFSRHGKANGPQPVAEHDENGDAIVPAEPHVATRSSKIGNVRSQRGELA